jgi:hypothetical protein
LAAGRTEESTHNSSVRPAQKKASAMTLKVISFLPMTCLAVWIAPYVYALYAVVELRTF